MAGNLLSIEDVNPGAAWKLAGLMAVLVLSLGIGLACGSKDGDPGTQVPSTGSPTLSADLLGEIDSLRTLVALYQDSGDYGQALPLLQQVLALQEANLGPEHEDTAKTHSDLGLLNQLMGNNDQALVHLQRALEIRERVLGADHPDTSETVGYLANLHYILGNFDQALPLFLRRLAFQETTLGADHPDTARSVDALADLYFNSGEYEEALAYFQRAVEFRERELGAGDLDTAQWRANLAQLHELLGNDDDAAKYYGLAVESTEIALGPTHVDVAARLNDLGELYLRQGAFEQALPQFQRAFTILSDALGPEHLDTVDSLRGIGESYRGSGDYGLALPIFQNALAIREKGLGANHPDTATSVGELAELYRSMGDYTQALPLSIRALDFWETQDSGDAATADSLATSLNNLGVLHQDLGDFAQAQQLLERALDIREQAQDLPDTRTAIPLATSLNNLAVLHKHTGNYAQSLPLLERALKIIEGERGPDHPDTAVSLNNLADFYFSINDFNRALPLYQRALNIMEDARGVGHPDTAPYLNNLADLYFSIEDFDAATPLFERALAIQEASLGPDHPETATYLSNLAVLQRSNGNTDEALKLYNTALEIRQRVLGPNHPDTATSLNNLGALYSSMGEPDLALSYFEDALEIRRNVLGVDHPDTAISLNNLGIWHESQRNYDEALDLFLSALTTEDSVINNMFSVASEEQKLVFTQANQGSYHATLSLIKRHFSDDQAVLRTGLELVLARKGIVLNSQSRAQAVIASNLQGESSEAWQRLGVLRGDLSNLLIRGPGDQDPELYKQRIDDLKAAIDSEEEFLAQNSSQMAEQFTQRKVTAQMLANRMPQDAMLVEYVRIRDWSEVTGDWAEGFSYLAFSLTPDNRIAMFDLGKAEQIDSAIIDAIATIRDPNYARDPAAYAQASDKALSELYTSLLEPLEADLKSHPRLIVSPDGEINKVPFAALRISDDAYLVETHTVSYVASGRDLLRNSQESASGVDLLLVADAAFDENDIFGLAESQERGVGGVSEVQGTIFGNGFPPLPGTAEEARAIPPLVQGNKLVLRRGEATEESVKSMKSPKVLHLATHGFFLEDSVLPLPSVVTASSLVGDGQDRGVAGFENLRPLSTENRPSGVALSPMVRSGLAFAGANHAASASSGNDGILTALEVTGMDLRGSKLVVLSACETAVGDVSVGEGIFGLRRAFVLAGAENLVMSLWLVNDTITVTQMERFYQEFNDGNTIPEALRQAQLETIATLQGLFESELDQPYSPVKLWAPFMVQQTGF